MVNFNYKNIVSCLGIISIISLSLFPLVSQAITPLLEEPNNIEFSTKVVDIQNNKMTLQQFKYFGNNATIRGKSIKITDIENNEYFLEDGMINLEENLLIGKDVLINLTAKGFEAPDAEPRLKGNAIYYGNNKCCRFFISKRN